MRGERRLYIIVVEIIPTMTSLLVASFLTNALYAVLFASSLQFIGLGDPNSVSWGTMLYWAENNEALQTGQYLWTIVPGALIVAARRGVRAAQLRVRRDRQPGPAAGAEDPGQACQAAQVTPPPRTPAAGPAGRDAGGPRPVGEYAMDRGTVVAVDHVSFDLDPGEFLGIVGESGCGKSTLLFAIAQLLAPPAAITGGSVIFKGAEHGRADRRAAGRGPVEGPVGGHAERDERAQPGEVDRRPVRRRDARARRDRQARRSPTGRPRCCGWSASTRCT